MNTQDIKNILDKSLGMPIGNVSDEWKAPSVVVGESDGALFVQTRAESKQEATALRDNVEKALSDKYAIRRGIIEFNSQLFRYWQFLTLKEK